MLCSFQGGHPDSKFATGSLINRSSSWNNIVQRYSSTKPAPRNDDATYKKFSKFTLSSRQKQPLQDVNSCTGTSFFRWERSYDILSCHYNIGANSPKSQQLSDCGKLDSQQTYGHLLVKSWERLSTKLIVFTIFGKMMTMTNWNQEEVVYILITYLYVFVLL